MRACTDPVRTGIGAVCVEYDRPKWPIRMLNHTKNKYTNKQINDQINIPGRKMFFFIFLTPDSRTTCYEEAFNLKAKNVLGRFAPSALPHYNMKRVK